MKLNEKLILMASFLAIGILFSTNVEAQSTCCKKKETKRECCSSKNNNQTSGCSPSSCRGTKTKFGEAKVITDLRTNLIALKADMEKSTSPVFSKRSYDIHGVIGETDDESISIITREVKLIETEFTKKTKHKFQAFNLPEQKAKQISYLNERISQLQKLV